MRLLIKNDNNDDFNFKKHESNSTNWRDAQEPPVVITPEIVEPEIVEPEIEEPEPETVPEPDPDVFVQQCDDEVTDDSWKKSLREKIEQSYENENKAKNKEDPQHAPKIQMIIENQNAIIQPNLYDQTIKCKVKQGLMFKINQFDFNDQEWLIQAQSVLAVLNTRQLNLFLNENVNSLLKSIELSQIDKLQEILDSNVYCFDILPKNLEEDQNIQFYRKPNQNALLSLCATSQNQADEWMKAITDFKQCYHNHPKFNILDRNEIQTNQGDIKEFTEKQYEKLNQIKQKIKKSMRKKLISQKHHL